METYRGYKIELDFIYHDPFTKVPTGLVDGMYYKEDDETAHTIYRQTLQQVRRAIDDRIADKTEYRVVREIPKAGKTITKFLYLLDAIDFAKAVNGYIIPFVDGQEEEMSFTL